MSSNTEERSRASTCLALLTVLLASTLLKLALILAPPADLYRVGKNEAAFSWIGEEIHRGTTALDFLTDTTLPVMDYQYAPFFGGALVVSVVAMPFFAWLGPSVSALKLTGLVFNGLATLFLFLALERCLGRRAAWIGSLLFALSPPGYSILAITAFGSHVETNAFAMAALYFSTCLGWPRGPGPASASASSGERPSRLAALGLGLTAGFGLYFSYILALSLAAIAATWIAGGRWRRLLAVWPALLSGFLVGFSPWLAYNLPRHFEGLSIYGGGLGGPSLPDAPGAGERVARLLTDGYPGSFFYSDLGPLSGYLQGATSALVLGCLACAAIFCLRARPEPGGEPASWSARAALRHPALALSIQPLLFVCAYAFTSFDVGDEPHAVVSFRYVYSIFPFVAGAAGATLAWLWSRAGAGRGAALLVTLGLLAPAASGTARLIDPQRWRADFAAEGYSYSAFGRFLVLTFAGEPKTVLRAVERAYEVRTPEQMHEMLFGMSMQMRQLLLAGDSLRPRMREVRSHCAALLEALRARVRPEHEPYFEAVGPESRLFRHDQRAAFWKHYRQASGH